MRATLALLRGIGPVMLIALLIVTIGTNLLDFATVPAIGARPGPAFVLAAIVRVIGVFWIAYALSRRLVGTPQPFRPGIGLLRFSGLQIVLLIGFGLATRIAMTLDGPSPVLLATQWLAAFVATALFSLVTLPTLAWNVALALDAPFRSLGAIWRNQTGALPAIARAFVGLVLPVAAVHLAMTLVALRIEMGGTLRLAIGIIDGFVQALQLGLSAALGVVAWRIARGVD